MTVDKRLGQACRLRVVATAERFQASKQVGRAYARSLFAEAGGEFPRFLGDGVLR
jgi:hypothetical protein